MANTQAYFGFTQYQGGAGGAPTFAQSVRRIASSSGAIYTGDPVMPAVSSANGYIVQASPGSTTLAGIFVGCKYLNTSLGRTVWSSYWPGSGATGDVEAYVIDDPNARFIVQTSTSSFPITGTLSTHFWRSGPICPVLHWYGQHVNGSFRCISFVACDDCNLPIRRH